MTEATERLARGELAPWTTVLARHQSQGRGRHDRSWQAAPGDAMMATIMAPIDIPLERLGLVALATGVAVAQALQQWGVRAALKWPNDVYLAGRKLGGILIQSKIDQPVIALVGIGINLRSVPPTFADTAVCLAEFISDPPKPRLLAEAIVSRLRQFAGELEAGKFEAIIDQWAERALWIGEEVSIEGGNVMSGKMLGIDDFGKLRLATAGGERLIAEGDVRRGPRAFA